MRFQTFFMLPVIAALLAITATHADPAQDIAIDVQKNGDAVVIDVDFVVPATPHEAWDVLTDFDRMSEFLPNLQHSKIIGNHDNLVRVEQSGKGYYGPFFASFQYIREIALTPQREMHSHMLSGSFQRMDSQMRLIPNGDATRILYHSESVPNFFLPAGIAAAVAEKTTRAQFEGMKAEILRRKATLPR
jgi:carbon monoxide dehydrogenase subunit G